MKDYKQYCLACVPRYMVLHILLLESSKNSLTVERPVEALLGNYATITVNLFGESTKTETPLTFDQNKPVKLKNRSMILQQNEASHEFDRSLYNFRQKGGTLWQFLPSMP